MFRTLSILLIFAALLGCANKQGIALPTSKPTQDDVADFNRRNATPQSPSSTVSAPSKDVVKSALVPEVEGPKLIIIGNVMALTVFDESTLNQRYDNYLNQLGTNPPAFTREWYLAIGSGDTAVKYSGVTGIYTKYFKSEIPKDLIRQISFASAFGTFMAGTSADLVVAQRMPKYGSWITHILCSEKDPKYSTCESQYPQGIFQSGDGREIDNALKIVDGGATIDVVTFKKK